MWHMVKVLWPLVFVECGRVCYLYIHSGLLSRTFSRTVSSELIGFCFFYSFSLFFVSVLCARLSSAFRQLFSARKYIVTYRIVTSNGRWNSPWCVCRVLVHGAVAHLPAPVQVAEDAQPAWQSHLWAGQLRTLHHRPAQESRLLRPLLGRPRHGQPATQPNCSSSLLLARLMGQCCFARWSLSASSVVVCNAGWSVGCVDGRVADTARRASTVTSSYGDTLLIFYLFFRQSSVNVPRLSKIHEAQFRIGVHVDHSKSQATDDKISPWK